MTGPNWVNSGWRGESNCDRKIIRRCREEKARNPKSSFEKTQSRNSALVELERVLNFEPNKMLFSVWKCLQCDFSRVKDYHIGTPEHMSIKTIFASHLIVYRVSQNGSLYIKGCWDVTGRGWIIERRRLTRFCFFLPRRNKLLSQIGKANTGLFSQRVWVHHRVSKEPWPRKKGLTIWTGSSRTPEVSFLLTSGSGLRPPIASSFFLSLSICETVRNINSRRKKRTKKGSPAIAKVASDQNMLVCVITRKGSNRQSNSNGERQASWSSVLC